MSVVDLESLLMPLSDEMPSGPSLEGELAYAQVSGTLSRRPSSSMIAGARSEDATDWRALQKQCLDLLGRTRDLQLAVWLTYTLVQTDGLSGLHDGLLLVEGYLRDLWFSVHPQLDPDDQNDPTMRANIVASLDDYTMMLSPLRDVQLCTLPRIGPISYRQIQMANGEGSTADAEETPTLNVSLIEGAFGELDSQLVAQLIESLGACEQRLKGIRDAFAAQVDVEQAPSFDECERLVSSMIATVRRLTGRKEDIAESAVVPSVFASVEQVQNTGSSASGPIRSRQDVIRAIDGICRWFESNEPSSPVPFLLRCARKLTGMSFVDCVRNLTPDMLSQLETILGSAEEQSGDD